MQRSLFSTQEVSELTGATVRQIGYWDTTGILKPSGIGSSGRGSHRRYNFRDLVAAQTIQKLRANDCALQKIRAVVKHLRAHYPHESSAEVLSRLILLTDGKEVLLLTDQDKVMEVVTRQLVWAVPLGRVIMDTQARVNELPTEWTEKVRVRGRPYHLLIHRDEETGEFSAQCEELPGAIEQGRTSLEAASNGKDAIESVLAYLERRSRMGAGRVASR